MCVRQEVQEAATALEMSEKQLKESKEAQMKMEAVLAAAQETVSKASLDVSASCPAG